MLPPQEDTGCNVPGVGWGWEVQLWAGSSDKSQGALCAVYIKPCPGPSRPGLEWGFFPSGGSGPQGLL